MGQQLRFSLRTLRRHGACLFAIGILAAGIGLSAAVFSLVKTVLLHPLPFPRQEAVRVIWKKDTKAGFPFVEMAYPELQDLQELGGTFESVAVMPTTLYGYGKAIQIDGRETVQVESAPVSHDFFRTLGVVPRLGRDFDAHDEHPGAAPVVILSDRVWREQFGGDAGILGRTVRLNGTGFTVIGVMAPGAEFPRGAGLWVPLGVEAGTYRRGNTYLQAIARVRPGVGDREVAASVNGLFGRRAREYPQFYSAGQEGVITSLFAYWTGSIRTQLWVGLGASLLLLAMAGVTASNLFLSRTFARAQEVATRASLGASPGQIAAQFALDGVVAAVVASVVGIGLASVLIRGLVLAAPGDIPRIGEAGVDGGVLLFSAAIALIAAMACSVAPALAANRMSLETVLRESGGRLTATAKARRWQNGFIAVQMAASVVLLAGCLVVTVGVSAMLHVETGFQRTDAVTMNLSLRNMKPKERQAFYGRLLSLVRDRAMIEDAGGVLVRPLEGAIGWDMHYRAEFEEIKKEPPQANFEVVTPGYFRAVGTALLEGRDFREEDREEATAVAVVSRSLAERFRRAGHPPIGLRLQFGRGAVEKWWTVVGVTADTHYRGVNTSGDDIYVNYLQTNIPVNYLVVRGRGDVVGVVRREVARLDAGQAVANVATIQELVDRNTARQRFSRALLGVFGLGALLLAAAGVFGVVAEGVALRRREMAICTVLGASRRHLLARVAGPAMWAGVAGSVVGFWGALVLGRTLPELLDSAVVASDWIAAGVPVGLLVLSGVAAVVAAWDAVSQEPRGLLQ